MNPELLLNEFHRLSEAPEAVPKLREFILSLAVRGRLVPQGPNDEPACELLKKIQADRGDLTKPWARMADTRLPTISRNEIPYQLPQGWEWARLGGLGDTNIGLTYSPQDVSDHGIPVLRSNNIRKGKLVLSEIVRVETEVKKSALVNEGDLLICARNGSRALVGKAAIITGLQEITAFGAFMAVFRSQLNHYLYWYICSPLFRLMLDEVNTTTINQITQTNLRSTLAPIPPLAEQHRIVAKIVQLMDFLDELEAAQAEREARRDKLVTANLSRLSDIGSCKGSFQESARFYFKHFPNQTARPEHIRQLRDRILELAVQGRLTNQNHYLNGDQTDKPPFALPSTWCWRNVEEIAVQVTDGEHATPQRIAEREVPLVTAKNVRSGSMDYSSTDWVSRATAEKAWQRCRPQSGDILMVCVGATTGRLCVLQENKEMVLVRSVALIRPCTDISSDFLALVLRSPFCQTQIWSRVKVSAQPCLYINRIKSLTVPLPPLRDQATIVARVNELMALCQELEDQINVVNSLRHSFLEAALRAALSAPVAGSETVAGA